MNSRERMITAITGGLPDRVPVSPWGLGKLDPRGPLAAELIKKTDPFISVGIGSPYRNYGSYAEVRVEGHDTITILHTPEGDLRQVFRRSELTTCCIEFFCKSADDVRKYLSIPYEAPTPDLTTFFRTKDEIADEGLVLAGIPNAMCLAAEILSPEDLCLLWADDPDLLVQLVKTASERLIPFVDQACRKGADFFRIIGGEYVTEQIGPKGVPHLLTPFDTELVKLIHSYNAYAHYHNHGNVQPYLDFFVSLGIDSLDPLENPPFGDANLAEIKKVFQGKVCIVGNIDDMEVMGKFSTEEVKAIARERVLAAGPDGFILGGTSSGTFTEHAARNFIALVDVVKELA
jgi:uroporphyrinogen decarboxylase